MSCALAAAAETPACCSAIGMACVGAVGSRCTWVLHCKDRHMLAANLHLEDLQQEQIRILTPIRPTGATSTASLL